MTSILVTGTESSLGTRVAKRLTSECGFDVVSSAAQRAALEPPGQGQQHDSDHGQQEHRMPGGQQ